MESDNYYPGKPAENAPVSKSCGSSKFYQALLPLCVNSLRRAIDPSTGLYGRQIRNRRWDRVDRREQLTGTAICLIGVKQAKLDPADLGLVPEQTFDALIELACSENYLGCYGLLIWANALWGRYALTDFLKRLDHSLDDVINVLFMLETTEAAWLLCGLAHEWQRSNQKQVLNALNATRQALIERYNETTNLFYFAHRRAPFHYRSRRWVGNFANQIYAIHALSLARIATGDEHGLNIAESCAKYLVELQGKLGQWWWLYDIRDGRIAQAYPVYSVHQYGMAPMALTALANGGGTVLKEAVQRSQAWLTLNELGVNLVDTQTSTVWRDIEYDDMWLQRRLRNACAVVGWKLELSSNKPQKLRLNYETRPYEWAWCLYAGALESSSNRY
jgi:hypothetical protein